jgi:golgin subfamily B member 1
MSQYATIPCPNCGRELRVRDAYFGMSVSCKHCDHTFVARPEGSTEPIPEEAPGDGGGRLAELERENRALREKCAGEAERARDVLDRLAISEAKRAQYKEQRTHLLGLREKYKQQIAALQDELGQVQERLRDGEAARDELAAARSELDALRAELPTLRERADDADRLGEEVQARRSEMERLWTVLQEHQRRADSGEAALAAESARAAGLQEELDRARERLGQGEAAATELDAVRAELDAVRAELNAARSELDRLRDEVLALRTRADDADRLEGDLRAEADRAEALAKRLEAETARVAELLNELGPARERLRIADDEHSALVSSRDELARLGGEVQKLRQRADDAERLEAEVRARRDEVARLRGELQESQEAGARASGSLSRQLDEASSARDRLAGELEGLRAEMEARAAAAEEVERLRGELAEERAGREQIRAEAARLGAEVEDRAALAAQNARLAADLDGARAECDRLRDEMARQEDRLSEQAREFDRLAAERAEAARRDPGPSFARGLSTNLVEPRAAPRAVLDQPSPAQGGMLVIRARPAMETEADPESLRADLEAWLSYAQERYRALIAQAGAVESQIRAARDDLTVLHRDMAIGQWGDEGDDEFPFG